ncbi:MAG: host-nuclease inhibitor Gam family protein [Bacteroidota bacterium]|nr:host-nuclease inhibitor Gam family protein [Bacteroidota bacterium]
MPKTKTIQKTTLTSFQDVDQNLRFIGLEKSFVSKREAQMNKLILDIQGKYEEETREARESIMALEKDIELYCSEHRDEFVESKTIALNYGLVSFRLSTPKLQPLRGNTWEVVLTIIKKLKLTRFIRVKEELDKDAIKSQYPDSRDLAKFGLQLTQSEQFYYEVNETPII